LWLQVSSYFLSLWYVAVGRGGGATRPTADTDVKVETISRPTERASERACVYSHGAVRAGNGN
jgi:hypothetical protein